MHLTCFRNPAGAGGITFRILQLPGIPAEDAETGRRVDLSRVSGYVYGMSVADIVASAA